MSARVESEGCFPGTIPLGVGGATGPGPGYICAGIYAIISASMHTSIHASIYVSIYARMYGSIYASIYASICVSINGTMYCAV